LTPTLAASSCNTARIWPVIWIWAGQAGCVGRSVVTGVDEFGEGVGDGFGHGRAVQMEAVGKADDLAADLGWGQGGDDGGSGPQGVDLSFDMVQPSIPASNLGLDD
jgi:hypothetical protein